MEFSKILNKKFLSRFLVSAAIIGLAVLALPIQQLFAAHTHTSVITPPWSTASTTTVYNIEVTNNGADSIDYVKISKPASFTSLSCGTPPAGWTLEESATTYCIFSTPEAGSYIGAATHKDFPITVTTAATSGTYEWQTRARDINNVYDNTNPTSKVDADAPDTATVTEPNDASYKSGALPASFTGVVADKSGLAISGMNADSATFYIKDGTTYWNGTTWTVTGTPIWLATTHLATANADDSTWTDAIDLPAPGPNYYTNGHTYEVKAKIVDIAGNSFEGTAVTFIYDTDPSTVTINTPLADAPVNASKTFEFTSTESVAPECNINSGAWETCATGDAFSTLADFAGLGQEAFTLNIRDTDAAGNVSATASRSLVKDTNAPASAVIGMVATNDVINAAEKLAGITLIGTNEAGVTITVNGHAATVVGTDWSYALVAGDYTTFGEGAETLTAISTDAAGNTSNGTRAINIDTLVPASAVINMVATNDVINAAEHVATVTVTGTNEAGSTVTLDGNAATVDGTTWSYILTEVAIDAFGEGPQTLTAIATDAAGNPQAAATTRDISVDTAAPASAVINMVATNDVINAAEHVATVTVTGTNEAGSTVTLDGNA
ncbi:MAG: hypothetical protein WC949_04435, partial [Candidatus Paceibacterota bacterium]